MQISVAGIQARQAFRHPFLIVLFPQSVVVQHGVPVWLRRQVVFDRGPAQNTLHVLRILPGVVNLTFAEPWHWQPVWRLKYFQRHRVPAGKLRIALQYFRGAFVLCFYPGHRSWARDIFQPLIFILLL
jgi:hypothetical protein